MPRKFAHAGSCIEGGPVGSNDGWIARMLGWPDGCPLGNGVDCMDGSKDGCALACGDRCMPAWRKVGHSDDSMADSMLGPAGDATSTAASMAALSWGLPPGPQTHDTDIGTPASTGKATSRCQTHDTDMGTPASTGKATSL